MKKIRIYNLFIFLAGLMCLSLGLLLIIKADFGVSVATSPPYVLSLYFTDITFGQWNYIIHGLVLLLLVLLVRKLTVKYLMSFFVSFLFGVTIDLFNPIVALIEVDTLIGRIGLFMAGCMIVAVGISSFIKSNYPILPFDTFVREMTRLKQIDFAKFKTSFDLSAFTVSVLLSLLFFGEIKGIHIGTFVSAMILGTMIGTCFTFMDKYIDGKTIVSQAWADSVLDFDLLNRKSGENFPQSKL